MTIKKVKKPTNEDILRDIAKLYTETGKSYIDLKKDIHALRTEIMDKGSPVVPMLIGFALGGVLVLLVWWSSLK